MIKRYTLTEMGSVWSDENKFRTMLEVEVLICEALAEFGEIPARAAVKIREKADFDFKRIAEIEKETRHDVIAFLRAVGEKVGKESRYIHLGATSYDIVDTSLSLRMVEAADIILKDLEKLSSVLKEKAREHKNTIMIGRSHGIHAEPITFGLKLAIWLVETERNRKRMQAAKDAISVGKISGAVGTYANINPGVEKYVCQKLGLTPASISSQILPRDSHAQYLLTLSLIASSLEKFSLEIRNLSRTEIMEVGEHFSPGQKGSSAMPHKRNPIISEQIGGLARIVRNNAQVALENISLWHERDLTHSSVERIIIPDSCILTNYILNKFIDVMKKLIIYPENMMKNLEKTRGLIFSEAVLLKLIEKGLSREDAYVIVQRAAFLSEEQCREFKDVLLQDKEITCHLSKKEIEECLDLKQSLRHINKIFSRLGIA
jgi:adenylosuccinate lyase